jgi:hypothetical protein
MKIREVVLGKWWPLGGKWAGLVIYPFIFFRDKKAQRDKRIRAHEYTHIEQVERIGWLPFYLSWLRAVIRRTPYRERWFEKEARDHSNNPNYVERSELP